MATVERHAAHQWQTINRYADSAATKRVATSAYAFAFVDNLREAKEFRPTEIGLMTTSKDIIGAVLLLQEEEQLLLVEELLDRLSPEADDLEADDMAEELERRRADFARGAAAEIPWSLLHDED